MQITKYTLRKWIKDRIEIVMHTESPLANHIESCMVYELEGTPKHERHNDVSTEYRRPYCIQFAFDVRAQPFFIY